VDRALLSFDLTVDLRPAFHWYDTNVITRGTPADMGRVRVSLNDDDGRWTMMLMVMSYIYLMLLVVVARLLMFAVNKQEHTPAFCLRGGHIRDGRSTKESSGIVG
jgi:hypothetical protein